LTDVRRAVFQGGTPAVVRVDLSVGETQGGCGVSYLLEAGGNPPPKVMENGGDPMKGLFLMFKIERKRRSRLFG
jgi:hypothetical protein